MKIKNNVFLKYRDKPEKHTKYKEIDDIAKHLIRTDKKKLYDYYVCDYCGKEIKIVKRWEEKTGGLITLPDSLTNGVTVTIALCNKCLNPVLKEFEEVSG